MRTKKRIAILTLLCFVLTVMPNVVLAEDTVALPRLAAPTNLVWNTVLDDKKIQYGTVGWDLVEECEGEYILTLYKDGEKHIEVTWHDIYDNNGDGKRVQDMLNWIDASGTYYFTVQAVGDGVNYADSEIAISDTWEYILPDEKLPAPTNAQWKNNTVYWNGVSETDYYLITFYKDKEPVFTTWNVLSYDEEMDMYYLDTRYHNYFLDIVGRYGTGIYTFTVQALSKNITLATHSEESAVSAENNIAETADFVSLQTNNLVNQLENYMPPATVRNNLIQTIDSNDLAEAMVTTESVRENIATVENEYAENKCISVSVVVADEVQQNGISSDIAITGAALNAETENSSVSLNVTKANQDYFVDPLEYKNTVFVDMDLAGADLNADGSLKVPVYITMPLPDNITVPDRFRILHYRYSSDNYETIRPKITLGENNIYYASFALTHFSPFAFAEEWEQSVQKGDVNGDGRVAIIDAMMVIQHIQGVIDLSANPNTDVDADGDIDITDAMKIVQCIQGVIILN